MAELDGKGGKVQRSSRWRKRQMCSSHSWKDNGSLRNRKKASEQEGGVRRETQGPDGSCRLQARTWARIPGPGGAHSAKQGSDIFTFGCWKDHPDPDSQHPAGKEHSSKRNINVTEV